MLYEFQPHGGEQVSVSNRFDALVGWRGWFGLGMEVWIMCGGGLWRLEWAEG